MRAALVDAIGAVTAVVLAAAGTVALASGPAVSATAAVPAAGPTNEDLRHLRTLAAPQLAPDGRRVLLQVTEATADGGLSHLWLVDAAGGAAPRQITWAAAGDKRGEHDGRWLPDGRAVLFLAKRGEHMQLYRLPMDGGESRALDLRVEPAAAPDAGEPGPHAAASAEKPAAVVVDVDDYVLAPDSRGIAVIARDPDTPDDKKRQEDKADAVHVDHDRHGKHLYLVDIETDKLTAAAVPTDVTAVFWSARGDRLIVITDGPNSAGDLGPARGAWLVERADPAHPVQLRQAPASIVDGAWSADGRQFYFRAQAQVDTPPGYLDLYVLDVTPGGSVRNLSGGLVGAPTATPLVLGDAVVQPVQQGTRHALTRLAGGRREMVPVDAAVISDIDCNAPRTGCAWLGSSSGHPPALYVAARPGPGARVLATPATLPAGWQPATAHVVQWTNDGLTLEGLLYLPPQASATGKSPLVVDVHGGPTGAWLDSFNPLADFLVAQGWAVLEPNPRGSTGYGAAFAAANRNDLGGGDLRDILAGVDAMLRTYPLDPQRLALIGYSYGGEMAGFVEGRTDRFRAIVSAAPVIDQHSEYGTEDVSWYDRWFYGKPWEHPDDAWRQSPLSGVAHARTPFLLLQGEADRTDPLGQSQEMYRALRQAGVPVELVQYPREDHGPLAEGLYGGASVEPWHGFDARERIVKFIGAAFTAATATAAGAATAAKP